MGARLCACAFGPKHIEEHDGPDFLIDDWVPGRCLHCEQLNQEYDMYGNAYDNGGWYAQRMI
jgi:hypothetical protein